MRDKFKTFNVASALKALIHVYHTLKSFNVLKALFRTHFSVKNRDYDSGIIFFFM
jgi:hypothetical protein